MSVATPVAPAGACEGPLRFDRLVWQEDRMLLDELVFRLEHAKDDTLWNMGDDCFRFFKIKKLMDQYEHFFSLRPHFRPANIMELGIWDGGSMALWFELFQPEKLVAFDIQYWEDSAYLQHYRKTRGLEDRLKTYWTINQLDQAAVRKIVADEFSTPLDLVMDDASHLYSPTLATFEVLFPLVRPGGYYVIEDWAWAHWQGFQDPDHEWALRRTLAQMIHELMEATGTSTRLITNVSVYEGFAVIERGPIPAAELGDFKLEKHILRRPRHSRMSRFLFKARRKLRRLVGKGA